MIMQLHCVCGDLRTERNPLEQRREAALRILVNVCKFFLTSDFATFKIYFAFSAETFKSLDKQHHV